VGDYRKYAALQRIARAENERLTFNFY